MVIPVQIVNISLSIMLCSGNERSSRNCYVDAKLDEPP